MSEIGNKTEVGLYIENLVASEGATYMEATLQWMDENSIDYSMLNKTVPKAIIDKISDEAIKNNLLRPSVAKDHATTQTLDDFM
ncbi:late promoters transcription protein [Escherichia phage Lw1]|uniref:Late transcription coactivator n=1 Tax=Escherichia phage Lw1 TaxID=1307804 RepID=M9UUY9_9CAUD|nr:late promoter transcriptional regulator [Escherichia phage Lw1]AGJ71457.1 late promoters transcription protein [Escherichia phage Lw1]